MKKILTAFCMAAFLMGCGDSSSSASLGDEIFSSDSEAKAESSSSEAQKVSSSESSVKSSSSRESAKSSSSQESAKSSSSSEKQTVSSSSSEAEESSSSTGSIYDAENNTLTDLRDNQVYKTVVIGDQVWMAENLSFETENSYCNENDTDCEIYGRYYTWGAAMDSATTGCGNGVKCSAAYPVRGVCPEGWHIPSEDDWAILIAVAGGEDVAGKALKSETGWYDISKEPTEGGTDEFGFSLLPSGGDYATEVFDQAILWTSTEIANENTEYEYRSAKIVDVDYSTDSMRFFPDNKYRRFTVRCLKD